MTDLRDEPDDVLEMDWGDYPDEDEPVDRVQTTNPDWHAPRKPSEWEPVEYSEKKVDKGD